MKGINFFNRFALICNLCFLIAMMSEYIPSLANHFVFKNFILILGLAAFVVNLIVILVTLISLLSPKRAFIGKFIFGLNIAFFALQTFYFFNK